MRDHHRGQAVDAVSMGGVEGLVFGILFGGVEVDAVSGGVAADRPFAVAVAEQGLVATVSGIAGALVAGELLVCAGGAGGVFDVVPEAAGADGLVLLRVADRDHPRARDVDGLEEAELFAGGREGGLVVDDRGVRGERDAVVGDRGVQGGGRVRLTLDAVV